LKPDPVGSTAETISLREYFEAKLQAEKEINQAYHESLRVALEIQAREYERRLTVLNHAHEEARMVLNTYVPREMLEASLAQWGLWRTDTDKKIQDLRLSQQSTYVSKETYDKSEGLLREWKQTVDKYILTRTGEGTGKTAFWAYIVGAIGFLTAVIVLFNLLTTR